MKAAICAHGSRGEVLPLVRLGTALAERGHEVSFLGPQDGERMVRAAQLPFRGFPTDMGDAFASEPAQRMLAEGRTKAYFHLIREWEAPHADRVARMLVEAGEGADAIVCSTYLDARCRAVAEANRVPVIPVHLTPIVPSRHFTPALLPQRRLGLGPLTRASHNLPFWIVYRAERDELSRLRRELGLGPARWREWRRGFDGRAPCLLGYSRTLFPRPADWPPSARHAGVFRLTPELRECFGEVGLPRDLDRWLRAGPPPIFFGFGGMPALDRQGIHRAVRDVLSVLGMRGILAAGWAGAEAGRDDSLFVVDTVEYEGLFPRCAAAVHHGGSGTTAASAEAGIPTLVCSVFAEQPFWGRRCRALGIGETFPFSEFGTGRLLAALREVLAPSVAARAREVGRQVAAEPDGAEAAVDFLEGEAMVGEGREGVTTFARRVA